MPIDPKVKTVFSALNAAFQNVQADAGLGSLGWWPEEGNHDCLVTDVNMQEQPARARPAPDIPFKPALQDDNGSRQGLP